MDNSIVKIFVFHPDFATRIRDFLVKSIPNVEVLSSRCLKKTIPKGQDIYILHASDITVDKLDALRKAQKKSLLYWLFGGTDEYYSKYISQEEGRNFDGVICYSPGFYDDKYFSGVEDLVTRVREGN